MRILSLIAASTILATSLGVSAANAASWNTVTCGDLAQMSRGEQVSLIHEIGRRDVSKTEPSGDAIPAPSSNQVIVGGGLSPVTARDVLAACEAKSPLTTIGELASTAGGLNIDKAIN